MDPAWSHVDASPKHPLGQGVFFSDFMGDISWLTGDLMEFNVDLMEFNGDFMEFNGI